MAEETSFVSELSKQKNEKASDSGLINQGFTCESKNTKVFVDDTEEQNVTKLAQVKLLFTMTLNLLNSPDSHGPVLIFTLLFVQTYFKNTLNYVSHFCNLPLLSLRRGCCNKTCRNKGQLRGMTDASSQYYLE